LAAKFGKMDVNGVDANGNPPNDADIAQGRKPRPNVLVVLLVSILVIGAIGWLAARIHRDWARRRITEDIKALVVEDLSSLPYTHDIRLWFGKFKRLSDVRIHRPDHFWALDTSLRFYATAHFERGQTSLKFSITSRRKDCPSGGGLRLDPIAIRIIGGPYYHPDENSY